MLLAWVGQTSTLKVTVKRHHQGPIGPRSSNKHQCSQHLLCCQRRMAFLQMRCSAKNLASGPNQVK